MDEPLDDVLRMIYRVSNREDLKGQERMALLAMWRMLGRSMNPLGKTLLAELIGTTPGYAESILTSLRKKGYIISEGRKVGRTGRVARRKLTRKIEWPPRNIEQGHAVKSPPGPVNTAPIAMVNPTPVAATDYKGKCVPPADAAAHSHPKPKKSPNKPTFLEQLHARRQAQQNHGGK